jgi:hypothetical protein
VSRFSPYAKNEVDFLVAYFPPNLPDNDSGIMPSLSNVMCYLAVVVVAFILSGADYFFLLLFKNSIENIPYADYADKLSF